MRSSTLFKGVKMVPYFMKCFLLFQPIPSPALCALPAYPQGIHRLKGGKPGGGAAI